jgi:hypothetical protein
MKPIMPAKNLIRCFIRFSCVASMALVAWSATTTARAYIIGPYSADGSTLHLYHFDENTGVGTTTADMGSASTLYVLSTTGGTGGGTTQGPAFSGFGKSLDTTGSSGSGGAEHIDNDVDSTTFWGPGGAFTWEALIKFGDLTTATGSMIALENEGSSGRYGRLIYKGSATAGSRFLNFNNLGTTELITVSAALPETGSDAINTTDWFHVAVAYNGIENTADNLKFYFTKLSNDSVDTSAHLLSSHNMTRDLGTGGGSATGLGDFAIGNNARALSSKFVGLTDEVRISGVARNADQFIFIVPEPSPIVLISVCATVMYFGWRRSY